MRAKQILNDDWNKVNKKDKTDGLSQKAVNAYRRENPGSKLQTAVTTKPSKLKAGSKDAKRRKSFCARMSGNKGPMKDEKGRPTPKAKALARWNCESIEQLEQQLEEAALGTSPKREKRQGSRPDRGHEPQSRYGVSKEKENEFHTKLDKLVHGTFGPSSDEKNESADELDQYDTHGLQGYYSDFHKDLHGFRPRHHSEEEFNNPEKLKELIRGLHKYMDALKATPEGRAQLKADGWHFDDEVDEGGFPTPLMPSHPLNPLNPLSPTYVAKSRENLDMDKVTARAKAMFAKGMTEEQVKVELIKQGVAERLANQAVQMGQMNESKKQKQDAPKPRNFVAKNAINTGAGAHKDKKKAEKQGDTKHKKNLMDLAEMEDILEKASRQLCKSSTPDEDLGASNLASCKSQGLRARDGEKSHLIGHGNSKVRIKVGGKRIKGKKYGGPLPDYGTRKGQ